MKMRRLTPIRNEARTSMSFVRCWRPFGERVFEFSIRLTWTILRANFLQLSNTLYRMLIVFVHVKFCNNFYDVPIENYIRTLKDENNQLSYINLQH